MDTDFLSFPQTNTVPPLILDGGNASTIETLLSVVHDKTKPIFSFGCTFRPLFCCHHLLSGKWISGNDNNIVPCKQCENRYILENLSIQHTNIVHTCLPMSLSNKLWSASLLKDHLWLFILSTFYFRLAGANILSTGTYQASPSNLVSFFDSESSESSTSLDIETAIKIIQSSITAVKLGIQLADITLALSHSQPPEISETSELSQLAFKFLEILQQNQLLKSKKKLLPFPSHIAVTLGSYGALLANGAEYSGEYSLSLNDFTEFYQKRLVPFLDPNSPQYSCLAFELIPNYVEFHSILKLLLQTKFSHSLQYIWITLSIRPPIPNPHSKNTFPVLADGSSLFECFQLFQKFHRLFQTENSSIQLLIGFSCFDPKIIKSLPKTILDSTDILYPNRGEKFDPVTKEWNSNSFSPSDFASCFDTWNLLIKDLKIFGGCCRLDPDFILEISQ